MALNLFTGKYINKPISPRGIPQLLTTPPPNFPSPSLPRHATERNDKGEK